MALKTTNPTILDQAERDYRGVYPSSHDYLVAEISGHLPPHLDWLPIACDPDKLRLGYETQAGRVVWTISLRHGVMVFEKGTERLNTTL